MNNELFANELLEKTAEINKLKNELLLSEFDKKWVEITLNHEINMLKIELEGVNNKLINTTNIVEILERVERLEILENVERLEKLHDNNVNRQSESYKKAINDIIKSSNGNMSFYEAEKLFDKHYEKL